MKLITPVLIALATLTITACSTLDGVGARLAASDVSLLDAALFIEDILDGAYDFDPGDRMDRIVAYKAVDTVAALRRGEITREQAEAEVWQLIDTHLRED